MFHITIGTTKQKRAWVWWSNCGGSCGAGAFNFTRAQYQTGDGCTNGGLAKGLRPQFYRSVNYDNIYLWICEFSDYITVGLFNI